jgi:thiamine kinase-like enzyme
VTIDEVIAGVPAWAGRDVLIESIEGGLTNANYRLTVGDEQFCVRIPGRDSSLLAVDRRAEHLNTLAAAEAGVGAAVRYTVGDEPVMVLEWIVGEVQDEDSLHREGAVEQIAASVRRLHDGPRFENAFDMFRIQQRYREICAEHGFRIPADYDDFEPVVRRIEAAMAVRGADLKPCNNDLLAANYIATPDGFRIIDYEYAGMNDPCFELGNTVAESKLGHERLERLIELYFGAPLRNRVARAHLWAAMANYGWTLWACIQREVSDIDFDFWAWGVDDKYARAVAAFTGPELEGWLADAQRSD